MGGVLGGSKGCLTCLKRRVKCDEKRPTCGRCAKAGYQCQGYARALEIRTHSFTNDGKEAKMLTIKPIKTKENARSQPIVLVLNSGASNSLAVEAVPQSLSLVAFKDDLEFSYLFDNFVWRTYGTPWMEMSAQGKLGRLSLDACRGFAQSIFGKHHHQKDIELQGQVLHGDTIRGVSQELSQVGQPGSEELIVPILLLLMHASTTAERQASFFHVIGLNNVIQSCEPARFAKMPLRLAFESARSTLFTVSLISKRRLFMEQSAWKTEPWRGSGSLPKSPQNELIDIMVNIPGYLQDASEIEQETASQTRLAALIERLKSDLAAVYQWRWNWERKNPGAVRQIEPAEVPPGRAICDFRLIHKVLWFSSFTQATEILLYNAVLLCTLGLLWQLEPQDEIQPTVPPSTPLLLPGQYNSLYEPAKEICRAFEYQLLNVNNNRESALFWLLPLGVAAKVLENDTQYTRWIQSMLNTSKVTRGYGSGTNEFGFGHYQFLDVKKPIRQRSRD